MNQSVPAPVLVLATLIGLMGLVLWGTRSLGVQEREKSALEKSVDARIAVLAQQSGRDISKLSETDRKWLQNITQGHGTFALKYAQK